MHSVENTTTKPPANEFSALVSGILQFGEAPVAVFLALPAPDGCVLLNASLSTQLKSPPLVPLLRLFFCYAPLTCTLASFLQEFGITV